ncbi:MULTISPECIES: gluconate 2-dehydrogenase subunit 3 family protein [unclassified Imperialibacter]|uniref:gluconate 2-dehydrogenase subunit 3 family protein n=1 Tax=unclassified Imperialibacter TaxID=2629706 RepID=UPI001254E3BA|nr:MULTISPECIES: gluconate 2-dehydrogenase subunit 3 family protein [unclassified Imperialibacter]CAD5258737.1 conserved hypothetical protein [Imperialibacter sp. 89]CAD5265680.1 conserved hypothetical protein [Imperialibacter sp. 75]VVT21486.1 conserved hypothetical protein [Imperialibacter sp. EC-SDR9]
MNRRSTLKGLLAAGGAIAGLSLVEWKWHIVEDALHPRFYTRKEEELFSSIADTIIPAGAPPSVPGGPTEPIGALSTGTDKFLMKLLEKCYEKEDQDKLRLQMAALEKSAEDTYGESFADCTQEQRVELLMARANSEVGEEKEFFDFMKDQTIRGFTTTQVVMTNYRDYKVAPGHFYGCANV